MKNGHENNPGAYDCYAHAEPDEPMFILLGRDRDAPMLVQLWAELRERAGENPAKVEEARLCAVSMSGFRIARAHRKGYTVDDSPETVARNKVALGVGLAGCGHVERPGVCAECVQRSASSR